MAGEGNRGRQGVAKDEIAHGKGIVATGPYAILGEIIFQEVVALLVIEWGTVLPDGDVKGNILVCIPLGV